MAKPKAEKDEPMERPKRLYFTGHRDAMGVPIEWFGPVPGVRDGIPAKDLDSDETAQLTEAQWEAIESPAGRRLYSGEKPESAPVATGETNPPSDTGAPPVTG